MDIDFGFTELYRGSCWAISYGTYGSRDCSTVAKHSVGPIVTSDLDVYRTNCIVRSYLPQSGSVNLEATCVLSYESLKPRERTSLKGFLIVELRRTNKSKVCRISDTS
jgi:hypothetical protein